MLQTKYKTMDKKIKIFSKIKQIRIIIIFKLTNKSKRFQTKYNKNLGELIKFKIVLIELIINIYFLKMIFYFDLLYFNNLNIIQKIFK